MIFWTGYGIIVPLLGFASLILTEFLSEMWANDKTYYQQNRWLVMVAMALAAVLTTVLYKLLKLRKTRTVIDKETGEEFPLTQPHSFMFVPLVAWPWVFLAFGVAMQFFRRGA